MLPAVRSPRWALVFVLLTLALSGAWIGAAAYRHGPPGLDTIGSITGVMAFVCAALSLIGWLGGRATFTSATLGLIAGTLYMFYIYATSPGGMADLGALVMLFMLGGGGLVLGMAIDIIAAIRRR